MNETQQQAALMAQIYPVLVLALILEGGKAMREAKSERSAGVIGFFRAGAGMGCIIGLLTSLLTVFEVIPAEESTSPIYLTIITFNLCFAVLAFALATLPGLTKDDDLDDAGTQRQD